MSVHAHITTITRAIVNTLLSCMEMQRRINRFHTPVR